MITDKRSASLEGIAASGGSLEICGKTYMSASLERIASAGRKHNAKLIIHNSSTLMSASMERISLANPGNVTFK